MSALKSIRQKVRGRESTEASLESAATGGRTTGHAGADGGGASLSMKYLVGRGKSDQPIVRPRGSSFESFIGDDDRTRVLDTQLSPWRQIAALRIFSPFGAHLGTAWFVGPKTLVTAGHCVYHERDMGGWAQAIEVSPGRNGDEIPIRVEAIEFSALDRWIETHDPNFDIAALHLEDPIGEQFGWFAVASLPSEDLPNYLVNISGYPKRPGSGEQQWFHMNRISHVEQRRIYYDVDTFGGQSGAPVWIHETPESEPLVIGIHAYGEGATPSSLGIEANSAPRIIPEVLDQIKAWINV